MKKNAHLDKNEIADVAAKLFAKKGFVGATLRDISKALNVSIASVYYHFKNKEEILLYIIKSIGAELLSALEKARSQTSNPLGQLRAMLLAHAMLIDKKGERVKVYVEEQHNLSKRERKKIYIQHREIYEFYKEQLEKLEKKRVIRAGFLPIAPFAIFGMINWCYRWYDPKGPLSIEQIGEKLTEILLCGIKEHHHDCD